MLYALLTGSYDLNSIFRGGLCEGFESDTETILLVYVQLEGNYLHFKLGIMRFRHFKLKGRWEAELES